GYYVLQPARVAAGAAVPIICDIAYLDDEVFALAQLGAILIAGESVLDGSTCHTAVEGVDTLAGEGARAVIGTLGHHGAVGRDGAGVHHVVAYSEDMRAEQRVRRFLDAAQAIITEKGSTAFPVQEVVARSRQSLRSFYQHFDGKHELLLALFEDALRRAV